MGSVGNKPSKVNSLLSNIQDYDKRLHSDILNAAERVHKEFPEIDEITSITDKNISGESLEGGEIAAMNGLGMLILSDKFKDYENLKAIAEDRSESGWLSGDGTIENSIIAHELGHNIDFRLQSALSNFSPVEYEDDVVNSQRWADAYSAILGREVKVGDTVKRPEWDYNTPYIKVDGKTYSINDLAKLDKGNGTIGMSSVIVPMALANIQDNYKKFGFKTPPTERSLISNLSRYANSYSPTDKAYYTEIFAECYSNHASYGNNGNVLAKEVMRITKQMYNSATRHKRNPSSKFFSDIYDWTKAHKSK